MFLVNLTFFLSKFTSARNVEFKHFDCSTKNREKSIVKEKFDIYEGFSELNVGIPLEKEKLLFLNIDDKYIENECIQRFKAYYGPNGSYDYISDYMVGDDIIYSSIVPTLVTFYDRIRLLTDGRSNFREELVRNCEKNKANKYYCFENDTKYMEWRESLDNALLSTKEYKGDDKEEYFSIFKNNLISLLEIICDKDEYEDFYKKVRSLKINELYSIQQDVYRNFDKLNKYMNKSSAMNYIMTKTFENMIKPSCIWSH